MRAPTIDPVRAWKDHRRTCDRCDLGQPGCPEGRDLYASMRDDPRQPEPLLAFAGSRMGTAFVWGFWFTIGAGLAAVVVGVLWAIIWIAVLSALIGDLTVD